MEKVLARSKSFRPLAGRKQQQQEPIISEPKFVATDAEPRNDLWQIGPSSPPSASTTKSRSTENANLPGSAANATDRRDLMEQGPPITVKTNNETFDFPTPSPKAFLYTAEVRSDGPIGMALGSPTQAAPWNARTNLSPYFGTQRSGTVTTVTTVGTYDELPDTPESETGRLKLSRWKTLGGLFGKRTPSPQQPFYQMQPSPAEPSPLRSVNHDEPGWSRSRARDRTDSPAKERPEKTPNPEKENKGTGYRKRADSAMNKSTERAGRKRGNTCSGEDSPLPPPKDLPMLNTGVPKMTISGATPVTSPIGGDSGRGMLNIDIPSIEMERYSVMFGSLLQGNNRSSSLLHRRQGNPEKLTPLNQMALRSHPPTGDENRLMPHRRATSPTPSKSPTFSLFPPEQKSKAPSPSLGGTMNRPRPPRRSFTAPAASPSQPTFSFDRGNASQISKTSAEIQIFHDPSFSTSTLSPITPSTAQSFDSTSTAAAMTPIHNNLPVKPQLDEPAWEMVTAAPHYKPNIPSSGTRTRPRKISEPPTPTTPMFDDMENANVHVAQVQIARTVSVSRAQGRSRPALRSSPSGKAVPLVAMASKQDPGKGGLERLVDGKKPLTPTLVELKNRKSQRVQLVDA